MALSSEWSQFTLAHAGHDRRVVAQGLPSDAVPNNCLDKTMPVIIRRRDPSVFVASKSSSSLPSIDRRNTHKYSTNCDTRNTCDDSSNTKTRGNSDGKMARSIFSSLLNGRSISDTFWTPSGANHEIGLLETLYRRGEANRTYVVLQSRPLEELQFNFSTCTGYNIDLSSNGFRLSKTWMALHHMDRALGSALCKPSSSSKASESMARDFDDGSRYSCSAPSRGRNTDPVMTSGEGVDDEIRSLPRPTAGELSMRITARDFSSAVRNSFQSLQEDSYYLVRYRDYSAWALQQYSSIAKRDGLLGRRYVEQCFAVHVSRDPGEFIPITEAQFLFGVDVMQRELLNELCHTELHSDTLHDTDGGAAGDCTGKCRDTEYGGNGAFSHTQASCPGSYHRYHLDINFSSLNADQFRSLGAVVGDGMRPMGVDGEELKRRMELDKQAEAARAGNPYKRTCKGSYNNWTNNSYYDSFSGDYVAPAWYDWSPGAVRARVRHRLSMYYHAVGRLTVQMTVLGLCMYVTYRGICRYLPCSMTVPGWAGGFNGAGEHGSGDGRGGGNGYHAGSRGRVRGAGGNHYSVDSEPAYVLPRSLLGSVFMGPKSVLDYILAPADLR